MTTDLFGEIAIHPGRHIAGRLVDVLATPTPDTFETAPVARLALGFEGVPGDRHAGFVRPSGGREPWYERGTEIRSGRQLSIVSVEDLAEVAAAMELAEVAPAWIGANIVIRDVPRLSFLPTGTRLFFDGGAVVVVEGQNAPCRFAGAAIARHTGAASAELGFRAVARRLRGVVASVERPGAIEAGGAVAVKIPEQWIY
ncbi:MOSC domain-containing protein [Methylopila henanensis]|uniref:MOSC domain-containing protein n=1 Tax=Methylopila henanensis TaxID=873516 RepID=A0ABW4KB36_9HYPH